MKQVDVASLKRVVSDEQGIDDIRERIKIEGLLQDTYLALLRFEADALWIGRDENAGNMCEFRSFANQVIEFQLPCDISTRFDVLSEKLVMQGATPSP